MCIIALPVQCCVITSLYANLIDLSLYNFILSCIYCVPKCILLTNLHLFDNILIVFVGLIRVTIRLLMLYFTSNDCHASCLSVFRADKIPAAQYSSYVESCQKQRQQDSGYSLLHSFT